MSQASEVELLMLELINGERTSRGLDPLTINNALNETSEDHSQWMLNTGIFDHAGVGGSSSGDRIAASDYALEGNWRTAENIGWQSERGAPGIADDVADIHESLMNSPGHRANILNPDLEDIGIGIETGGFQGYDGVMITQNFGRTDAVNDAPAEQEPPMVMSENDAPAMPVEPPVVNVAPAEEETLAETPDEAPEDADTDGSDVTTFTNSSSGTVTATAGPDGPSVVVDGEGNFTAEGIATNGDKTVTDAASGGSLAGAVPGESGATPMAPNFDRDAFFDGFFNRTDLADLPMMDVGADDTNMVATFEGSIATGDETFTTNNPVEFQMMFADIFSGCDGFDFG